MKEKEVAKDKKNRYAKKRKKKIGKKVLIFIIIILLLGIGWFTYRTIRNGGGISGMLATVVGHNENTKKDLKEIKVLILDVDNTLIDYYENLSEEVQEWAKNLRGQGVKLYILSNSNKKEKVEKVAKTLEIPYKNFAMKPFKKGFLQIQKEIEESPEHIAVIGDQIFTDILGGNRCKMFTILVEPINPKDYWYTAWKRPIENKIKSKMNKVTKEK